MLKVSDLSKRHGDRLILDHIGFTLNDGDRVGLVGPNGAGKTTLLEILAGRASPDSGTVAFNPGVRVGYLRQGFSDRAAASLGELVTQTGQRSGTLIAAADRLDAATRKLGHGDTDSESALAEYDEALAAFEAHGGYQAVDELTEMLAALGVTDVPFSIPLARLSGGQKTRAGLAALLAEQPDLLLLDEPTNHLDLDALAWLETFLTGYRGAVIIVSHDRAFLDHTVTAILELDDVSRRLTSYQGGYSDFLAAKATAATAHADAYARQQREIARIEQDIRAVASHAAVTERATQHDFYRARAKKVARTAKVRERKLERLLASEERIDKPERRWGLALEFTDIIETGRDVATLEEVNIDLGGRRILSDVNLHIRYAERIAITGPNGAGKSTLLRAISGELTPISGDVRIGSAVVLGQYAQEQETVKLDRTVLDQARAAAPISETEARSFLHRFLFGGDTVFRRAGDLSYGERARLALALLVLRGSNVLLLDEPMNHLDLPAREQFEEALANFDGTILMVSHDRYAIARLANRVLVVRDGIVSETAVPMP